MLAKKRPKLQIRLAHEQKEAKILSDKLIFFVVTMARGY